MGPASHLVSSATSAGPSSFTAASIHGSILLRMLDERSTVCSLVRVRVRVTVRVRVRVRVRMRVRVRVSGSLTLTLTLTRTLTVTLP